MRGNLPQAFVHAVMIDTAARLAHQLQENHPMQPIPKPHILDPDRILDNDRGDFTADHKARADWHCCVSRSSDLVAGNSSVAWYRVAKSGAGRRTVCRYRAP